MTTTTMMLMMMMMMIQNNDLLKSDVTFSPRKRNVVEYYDDA